MTLESYSAAKWKKEGNTKLPFNPICTKKSYSVELSMYDFYALIQYDDSQEYAEEGYKSLLEMLEIIGACDVDFHGMFGAYIFMVKSLRLLVRYLGELGSDLVLLVWRKDGDDAVDRLGRVQGV